MDFKVAITTDPEANVTFRLHFTEPEHPLAAEIETVKKCDVDRNCEELNTAHEELLSEHARLEKDTSDTRERLLDLSQQHTAALGQSVTAALESEQSALASRKAEVESACSQKDKQVADLTAVVRDQDFRKKNAEMLLGLAEKEGKEKIEEHVRKEKEVADWRKKAMELSTEVKRVKKDLEHEEELTTKRDQQVELLLAQLQKKEMEQEQLKKELARREEERKRLQEELATAQSRAQLQLSVPRDLQEARGLAEARAGEIEQAKETIRTIHQQLRQKEGEVHHLRKRAEAKSVRLPPIQSASGRRPTKDQQRKSVTSETPVPMDEI